MNNSPHAASCEQRTLWTGYALALLLAGALYVVSVAPGPLWQDNGLAQVRTLERDIHGALGLAHSHPLFYLFTIAFQVLPFQESAYKTNLVAAVFSALTVANVYLLVRLLTGRCLSACLGAVAVAVAHTFWLHGCIAEVYSLTTSLMTGELLCLTAYARSGSARWLMAMFLLNGLGISNHLFALLSLACYAVVLVWLLASRRLHWRMVPWLAACWLIGAGLYLSMLGQTIAAGMGWSEALGSALFGTRNQFARHVLNPVPSRRALINTVLYLGLNLPTPAALLVVPGLLSLAAAGLRPVRSALAVLVPVHLYWAMRYDVWDQYTFFVPTVVLLAILIGLGSDRFLAHRSWRWKPALAVGVCLPVAVYLPLPWALERSGVNIGLSRRVPFRDEYRYFLHPWKTGYTGPLQFADAVARELPPGSVWVGDTTTVQPIWYLQGTGRWNADVRVHPRRKRTDVLAIVSESEIAADLAAGRVYLVSTIAQYVPAWLLDPKRFRLVKENHFYRVLPVAGAASEPASGRAD